MCSSPPTLSFFVPCNIALTHSGTCVANESNQNAGCFVRLGLTFRVMSERLVASKPLMVLGEFVMDACSSVSREDNGHCNDSNIRTHQVERILPQVLIVSSHIKQGWQGMLWMEASTSNIQCYLACIERHVILLLASKQASFWFELPGYTTRWAASDFSEKRQEICSHSYFLRSHLLEYPCHWCPGRQAPKFFRHQSQQWSARFCWASCQASSWTCPAIWSCQSTCPRSSCTNIHPSEALGKSPDHYAVDCSSCIPWLLNLTLMLCAGGHAKGRMKRTHWYMLSNFWQASPTVGV